MLAHLITALLLVAPQDQPVVIVDKDDVEISVSCKVVIPKDKVIRDANGNGVIHVTRPGISIDFSGASLRGAPEDAAPDTYSGTGVRIDDVAGVTLKRLDASGFKVAVWATRADGLTIEDAHLVDNFRQRLGSTPEKEDATDWLSPHSNDDHEWMKNYGASIYVERSGNVTMRRITVREAQNGIVLDRVNASKVYDCDASFLSGWGLAMWRSSRNMVSRNAFDFCIRGYSHKIYNRGQDSAGILVFEQCNDNVFIENSCTHGGDGIFGFGGSESLEKEERTGCNGNRFVRNDLSYAAAHGWEMTFSFDNVVLDNRFVENAICGIWGGYSQDTWISSNRFEGNGDMAYGLERGGINIEHGYRNRIIRNRFKNNACGIHLWNDADEHLMKHKWMAANHKGCDENLLYRNRFTNDKIAVQLRAAKNTYYVRGYVHNVETEIHKDDESELIESSESGPNVPNLKLEGLGDSKPVGDRPSLRGRHNIIMGTWGPWDHSTPLVRLADRKPNQHVWDLFTLTHDARFEAPEGPFEVKLVAPPQDPPRPAGALLRVTATEPGIHTYRIPVTIGAFATTVTGTILSSEWKLRAFAFKTDPREDLDGWLAEAKGAPTASAKRLRLTFGHGGPSALGLSDAITKAAIPGDRFGVIASTTLELTPGTWIIKSKSDDGIRVKVDGKVVIDDWTHHGTRPHTAKLVIEKQRKTSIDVMYFELDGYATLSVDVEKRE